MKTKRTTDICTYEGKCERLLGFKKLKEAGLQIPDPIKIITYDAFREYKKRGMSNGLEKEIALSFKEIKSRNPNKGVAIRRGYCVPNMESPPGPRSSSVEDPQIALAEIKKIFDFAINKNYDGDESEIIAFMHPFINPTPPMAGGNVTISKGKEILIEAIYGNDEGVLTLPHDSYWVGLNRLEIVKKETPVKPRCARVIDQTRLGIVDLEENLRNRQVLDDNAILAIGREAKKFGDIYKNHRLEFDIIGDEIYFTECTPINEKKLSSLAAKRNGDSITGTITKLNGMNDLDKAKDASILYISMDMEKNELMNLVTFLPCKIPKNAIVIFPGSLTSHPSIILRENHVQLIHTTQDFRDGERICIGMKDSKPLIVRDGVNEMRK